MSPVAAVGRFLIRRWPVGLALIVLAVTLVSRGGPFAARGAVEIIEVEPAPLVRRVEASGELRPSRPLTIGCPEIRYVWQYTITRLVEEGTQVEPGTPLVSFDTREHRERLDVRRQELETARRELDKVRLEEQDKLDKLIVQRAEAEAKLARLRRKLDVPVELVERNELAKTRIEADLAERELELNGRLIELQRRNMKTRIAASEQRVAYLEGQVKQIERNIAAMTVRAPRGGFVALVPDWQGKKPKVGETVWEGRPLIEIADLSQMQVAAEIDEPDAAYVAVGQQVEIRLDAAPERRFTGRVERLGRLFRTKSSDVPKKVVDAVVSIDDPDPDLMRPGMAAQLTIVATAARAGIRVPERAVRPTPEGPVVRVRGEEGERWVRVELGDRWQGDVVVERGLEPGDRVVVPAGSAS